MKQYKQFCTQKQLEPNRFSSLQLFKKYLGMKRIIKFRAWDEADGFHIDVSSMSYGIQPNCDADAIMQFTGMLDKNEKEIYEGDLIRLGNGSLHEVYWHEQYHWSKRNYPENEYSAKTFQGSVRASKFIVPVELKFEVVGNIYENPELT